LFALPLFGGWFRVGNEVPRGKIAGEIGGHG
jgi:hypothetical protein